jgi:hypothetical protein
MPASTGPGTPISRYRDKKRNNPNLVGLLAEGDSWFAFPSWLRTNIIEELIQRNGGYAAWLTAAANGDEARQMLSGGQFEYLVKVLAEEGLSFDGILFSGGGNDIVGRCLLPLLNRYQSGMTWMDCINLPRFEQRLRQIESAYDELAHLRDDYQPNACIFTHGYDYAIPSGEPVRVLFFKIGPWLKKHMMEGKGITDGGHQRKIIDYMLSRFDDLQVRLEQTHDRWVYVRTQGTLKNSEWKDELHPTTQGFQKVARKFQAALAGAFPTLPKS